MEGPMADVANVELIRGVYEAFLKGDMEVVGAVLADNVKWHVAGRSPLACDLSSKQEVFARFGLIAELSSGTFSMDLHDVVGNNEHVVVLVRETGSRRGKTLDMPASHVWHVRHGKAVEFWALAYDQYTEDAFWS
jgi:ketosteroid isomerase-like protein